MASAALFIVAPAGNRDIHVPAPAFSVCDEDYFLHGLAEVNASANKGIRGDRFLEMYEERFGNSSVDRISKQEYEKERTEFLNSVIPKSGIFTFNKLRSAYTDVVCNALNLDPKSDARKHIHTDIMGSNCLGRYHSTFLTLARDRNPGEYRLDVSDCGTVLGVMLMTNQVIRPEWDPSCSRIQNFCYYSLAHPVGLNLAPKNLDPKDKFMCLYENQPKWCYLPSETRDSSQFMVGSIRYYVEEETEEGHYGKTLVGSKWKVQEGGAKYELGEERWSLGNLYVTDEQEFTNVHLGIYLGPDGRNIRDKDEPINRDIQKTFMDGLKNLMCYGLTTSDSDWMWSPNIKCEEELLYIIENSKQDNKDSLETVKSPADKSVCVQ